jgi:hypothetical protein
VIEGRWHVHLAPARPPVPKTPLLFVKDLPAGDWTDWLAQAGLRPGTP